jgi:hypothetical protein
MDGNIHAESFARRFPDQIIVKLRWPKTTQLSLQGLCQY